MSNKADIERQHHLDDTILVREMKKLRLELEAMNSFMRRFSLGVLTGFGTVVGATVVVALVVFILSKLATIETIKPFVEQIVHIVENKGDR